MVWNRFFFKYLLISGNIFKKKIEDPFKESIKMHLKENWNKWKGIQYSWIGRFQMNYSLNSA